MKRYTVKQLASLSGVSVRTLHYYDQIGLLRPAFTGENRYRYYGSAELLRLQQILFHRELDVPLLEIAALLDRPGFDRIAVLMEHRARLLGEADRYRKLVETIDRTIAGLKGERAMEHADLYRGFAPQKQEEYEKWLLERYGADMQQGIDMSKAKYASLSESERAKVMADLARIEADLAESCRRKVPAELPALDPVLTRHRDWVGFMWDRACAPHAYAGLADLYLAHPDFRSRYETLAPGFCEYLVTAMKTHAARHSPTRY
jgi:DNA-binding transcriptional MerR regulator